MNRKIALWSVIVAVSGFLFGFDTAVISGADQPLQRLWDAGDLFHGLFIMSSALWGTVIGALFGNIPAERYGRKASLIAIGLLYLVSALGSALAPDPYIFSFMRFIGGLGVGASSIVAPAFISEIAPARYRGRLVALYQFQLVFGILVAFFSNYALSEFFGLSWRWMLGAEAVPALAYLLLVLRVPESPRWLLLRKNDDMRAREILAYSNGDDVDRVIADIRHAMGEFRQDRLLTRAYLFPVLLAFLAGRFQPAVGDQFHHLLRAKGLRVGWPGRQFGPSFHGRHRPGEPGDDTAGHVPDRPGGPQETDADRLHRVHRLVGHCGLGLRLRCWRHDGGVLRVHVHRLPRRRPGRRDLGVHRGNLPQQRAHQGAVAGLRYSLGVCSAADPIDALGAISLPARINIRLLRRDDGVAVAVRAISHARDQGPKPGIARRGVV